MVGYCNAVGIVPREWRQLGHIHGGTNQETGVGQMQSVLLGEAVMKVEGGGGYCCFVQ